MAKKMLAMRMKMLAAAVGRVQPEALRAWFSKVIAGGLGVSLIAAPYCQVYSWISPGSRSGICWPLSLA